MTAHSDAIQKALRWANYYRRMGWQPLPSRTDVKGPALPTYADYWDCLLPDSTYEEANWKTTNIQVMCGAHWGLMVVDCDGAEAHDVWLAMIAHHGGCPDTWMSRTGGGGWHYWFAVPPGADSCPARRLWGVWDTWAGTALNKPGSPGKGNWRKHQEVRILGDGALVIAPPSIHVDTGRTYEFGPRQGIRPRPAFAPDWLMQMPEVVSPDCSKRPERPAMPMPAEGYRRPAGASFRREEVLAAIPSKIDVAKRWGLRVASPKPNAKGWWPVHAIDRDDDRPSASFHDLDGVYWESRDGSKLSLFDLAVALGAFADWRDARDSLGDEFCRRP